MPGEVASKVCLGEVVTSVDFGGGAMETIGQQGGDGVVIVSEGCIDRSVGCEGREGDVGRETQCSSHTSHIAAFDGG